MSHPPSLDQEFDDLIELLKKIQANANGKMLGDVDISFLDDFNVLIDNYSLIKSTLTEDIASVVGQPLLEMVQQLIAMLKEELFDVYKQGTGGMTDKEITDLDALMKKEKLSVKELDALLDKRIELMNKQSLASNLGE